MAILMLMPLSWNEIKIRANAFSKEWEAESREDAEAKSFWDAFFDVFGMPRRRIASFEEPVKKSDGKGGFIDLLWRGQLLVEHKSRGKNLDKAFVQAMDYFPGLKDRDLPKYILVSDFSKFRLYNLETNEQNEFALKDLYQNVKSFGFIAGYQTQIIKPQDPINIKAAVRMGKLHDALKTVGYTGHALELYLVRLLFCLFAEDTTIFEKRLLQDYIETNTKEDGSDLAHHLSSLFYVLNTPSNKRLNNLDESLAAFPYVNGKLFEESLPPAQFDRKMREALLDLCALDWSIISPAIFGSLFQSIMDADARRNLGAHYTSEENILKLIKPLFLDALWAEFEKVKSYKTQLNERLNEFHKKLRALNFLDPACGCGNFLVITYRELRLLELEVLRVLYKSGESSKFIGIDIAIIVDVDQFYGIEIEEFPAQIAQVALWLTDHQMNMKISEEFGNYFARIPLKAKPHIVCDNALQTDWTNVLPPTQCSFILGNPPFLGKSNQSAAQKSDLLNVFGKLKSASDLDFVAAWYVIAARYIKENPAIHCAFVSTNSITQGEQVAILWPYLFAYGVKIHFAHRTFQWNNEGRSKAAVHCVIVGFGLQDVADKTICEYADIKGEPHVVKATNINPYLRDSIDVIAEKRQQPISNVPPMRYGNKPTDDGNFIFTDDEKREFLIKEPNAAKFFRLFIGAEEFINNKSRWCLWLKDADIAELRAMPAVMDRVKRVQEFRLKSTAKPTRLSASTPTRFFYTSQPDSAYLLIPETSSENRNYIPIGFVDKSIISSNATYHIPNAEPYLFGVLSSAMHNGWMRTVGGRLKNDYRYSGSLVYNTFPWPALQTNTHNTVEACAQAVLDARAEYANASLADLYDPLTMPANLLKAHQALDKAVDAAYGYKGAATDAARVAFLFERYQQLTSLLPSLTNIKTKAKKVVKKSK
jgi:type II restriction/modification system DNA methylase subunit YeeA